MFQLRFPLMDMRHTEETKQYKYLFFNHLKIVNNSFTRFDFVLAQQLKIAKQESETNGKSFRFKFQRITFKSNVS